MPELPEVETVKRGLKPFLEGATIETALIRRPDLRFPFPEQFAQRLSGRRIQSLSRRAKYLLAMLDSGETLIMHLGMSGSFRIEETDAASIPGQYHFERGKISAHDHVILELSKNDKGATVTYNDPRRFGFMDLAQTAELHDHPFFRQLGIEPLGNELSADYLAQLFAGRKTPTKAALLDQRLIAGLGNIYVCEALYRAGISPRRLTGTLVRRDGTPGKRLGPLAQSIRHVLQEAIEAGGSSLRDHRRTDGELGYFQHRFQAYDREGQRCSKPGCDGKIRRIVQSGRSTFYCPSCQR